MNNPFQVNGDITTIFVKYKGKTLRSYISTLDLDKAQQFKGSWYADWSKKTRSLYVRGTFNKYGKRVHVRIHRWLLEPMHGLVVDHKNHDTLDNTRKNLRIVSYSDNSLNRKGANVNNQKSGVRGVYWNTTNKKWEARVTLNKVRKSIGLFNSIQEAEFARKRYLKEAAPIE